VRRYQNKGDTKFSTFAYLCARGYVSDYIRLEYRYRTRTESEDALESLIVADNMPTNLESKESEKEVGGFLSDLSSRQQEVCLKLYWEKRSQRQVGRDLGVSHKMVGKIVKQIYTKGKITFGSHIIAN